MKKINTCVVGITGKMSQAIWTELNSDPDFDPCMQIKLSRRQGYTGIFPPTAIGLDLVIDFTAPCVTMESAAFCAKNELPLVTGTTGLSPRQMARLHNYAKKTPILWSPNMSLAVNLIEAILPLFGQILPEADIAIVEQHHRHKEDVPSGTALYFAQNLQKVSGKKVAFNSIRGGQANGGKNEVLFLAGQEEITISHRVLSNQVYAQGALLSAKWLINQPPGFYSMRDLLPKF